MATNNTTTNKVVPVKKTGKVVITLNNVLIPVEKLATSPSQLDGLDADTEISLRIMGCELIQTSGILMKQPQVAMAAGQILFHRFYYAKSLVRYPMEVTAMACIALASKCEEAPRKIRDVISVFNHIKQVKNGRTMTPVILDGEYISLKSQVIKAERRLLKELGFCCHVKHPHKIIIAYLRVLEADGNKKLTQSSWNYMNDALRTDVFVRYSPETIACACVWLAGRQLRVPLPDHPPWYSIFKVSLSDIEEIAASILKLYTRKKVKLETLEACVKEIRKLQEEARLRSKVLAPLVTPRESTTFSPSSRTNTPSKVHSANQQKRSTSPNRNHGKHSGSSQSASPRHNRKKTKRSRSKSHSRSPSSYEMSHDRSRSRGSSRDGYYKKKCSHTPSPTVTPPPRFTKNKEKGFVVRSVSRSRSRSPHRNYDKYERSDKHRHSSDKYDKLPRGYEKVDRYKEERSDKRHDDKRSDKYLTKYPDKKSKRESKRSYDNGYEKHHKSKKNGRSRSQDREIVRRR